MQRTRSRLPWCLLAVAAACQGSALRDDGRAVGSQAREPAASSGPAEPVASPAPELLPILRRFVAPDCGADAEIAAVADSPAEWRELSARLRLPQPGLPADWADFARERIVVWACPRGHVWPQFDAVAATEEGVDVLTVSVRGPSGVRAPLAAPCLVLAVPRRPHPLSLVGRLAVGPAPAAERVLALLPAAH